MLTNQHDPTDTLETFQPVTVGIHVQEMKGFRKELVLSLLAPNAFEEGEKGKGEEKEKKSEKNKENNEDNKTTEKDSNAKKATKRPSQTSDAKRKKPKLSPVS